jgi:hypothetical protein
MFEGLLAWAAKFVGLWMSAVALGAPMPIAQAGPTGTQPGANISSEVLAVATATPSPVVQTTPVTPTPEPEKPKPADPPVVKPIKPPKCYHLDNVSDSDNWSYSCRCWYTAQGSSEYRVRPCNPPCGYDPGSGGNKPDVYMCRAPME